MDALTINAASGMRARLESMDMLAHNIANSTAAGFKADRESYSLYVSPDAAEAARRGSSPSASMLPVIERHWTDFSQGILTGTANPLDLALYGEGFFLVRRPQGLALTRNGHFRLSPAGVLETQDGHAVLDVRQRPIVLDANDSIEVAANGEIHQGGQMRARLHIVKPASLESLSRQGAAYFTSSEAGFVEATAQVRQNALEGSNVTAAETAVRLMTVLRQFESLQRALTLGGEMNKRSVEELARVGG